MSTKIEFNSLRLLLSNGITIWWRLVFKIFLNIYLWKETNDIQLLASFNLVFLLWHILSFIWVSPLVKLWYRRIINLISYIWFILTYIGLILLWENITTYIFIVWFVFWIFNWAYYVTFWVNQFDLTTFKNRGNFEWTKKWIKTFSKMVFPALVWFIIWIYNIDMALVFWIFCFIIWFFISDIKIDSPKWRTHYRNFSIKVLQNKRFLYSLLVSFFFTLSFSVMLLELIIPLLIFTQVWTEIKLWFSLSLLSFLSIAIIYLFWKIVDYKYYNKTMILVCVSYIISLLWLVFSYNYSLLLFFSTLVVSLSTLYSVWVSVITTNSIHSLKNYNKYRVEFIVFKEILYVLWWMCSFLLMYFSSDLSQSSMKIIFYTMILFSIVSTIFLLKINMHEIEEGK